MRICMLVKNSFEFDARVSREATTLQEAGHTVTVVALRSASTPPRERQPDGVQVVRVARPAAPLQRWVKARLGILSTATPGDDAPTGPGRPRTAVAPSNPRRARAVLTRGTRRLLDRELDRRLVTTAVATDPDVVHAHDLNTLAAGASTASSTGAHLVYDSHELATGRNLGDARDDARARALEGRLIARADAVITASPGYTAALHQAYDVDPVTVLNVPVRQDDVAPAGTLARRAGARLAVYVGSIQENRGLETAILALPEAPSWDLAVVGYGHHRPVLEALARRTGVEDRVHFHGPVPHADLLRTAAGADVGLCLIVGESASYRMSVPNKLFEYFAAGLPVVAADLPEIAAIAGPTGAGVLCDPRDSSAVAGALRALADPDVRSAHGRAGRQAHLERYHWEHEQAQLLRLYHGLSSSPTR